MATHKTHTCLVYDNGLFLELAVTLSKQFGRVLYYAPWTSGYPKSNALRIGQGIKGIERVKSPFEAFDDVDLWVFPDVYEGEFQQHLVDMGKRVWGCRMGGELELDRPKSKEMSKKLGIDIGPYEVITGLDALREHLKENEDVWVKISATRGDMETFHAPNYERAEPRLDELEHNLGAKKKVMEFICEKGINDAIEIGYDGYTIDGKFPKGALVGVEVKDEAYVARTMRYSQLPEAVRSVNQKLVPALKEYGYRGFISTEIRCVDDKAYLIDPCARCGSPPSELYQNMIANLADILWEGAEGIVVEPEYKARCGAQVMIRSAWADSNWQQIDFPEAIREHVKLRNFTVIEGQYYVIPQWCGCPDIGAVVAMGDTQEEAMAEVERLAEMVKGHQIEMPVTKLEEAAADLDEFLGPDKPPSALERKVADGVRSGKISAKQAERMLADG